MPKKSKKSPSPASSKQSTPGQPKTTPIESEPAGGEPSTPTRAAAPRKNVSTPKRRLPLVKIPELKSDNEGDGTKSFAVPKLRRYLRQETSEDIDDFAVQYQKNTKRNFSQLSAISNQSDNFKHLRLETREGSIEAILEYLKNKAEIMEHERDGINKLLKKLNEEWHGGHIDTDENVYREQIAELEKKHSNITTDLIVLRTSKYELCGRLIDGATWKQDQDIQDWSQIDPLIRLYKTPEGARCTLFAKREPSAQDRFRAAILKAYGALIDNDKGAWCVISGKYYNSREIRAAHIVRYNVGEPTAGYLFGPSEDKDGHIMGAKNGLPMHQYYEEDFDEGRLIIVPDESGPGRWKTQWLLESDIQQKQPEWSQLPTGAELHNRPLEFKNDFRPASRYLYFAYCMSILRRQRHEVPGWWKDRMHPRPEIMWGSPGAYLRTSILRKMAHRVGHLTEDESHAFSGEPEDKDADKGERQEIDSVHSDIASQGSMKSPMPAQWNEDFGSLGIGEDEVDEDKDEWNSGYDKDDDDDVFN